MDRGLPPIISRSVLYHELSLMAFFVCFLVEADSSDSVRGIAERPNRQRRPDHIATVVSRHVLFDNASWCLDCRTPNSAFENSPLLDYVERIDRSVVVSDSDHT
jgi:hypothetical protein